MKLFKIAGLVIVPSLLTLNILMTSASASAAVWQPTYTPGQLVYLDPALADDPQSPVNLDGLQKSLETEAAKYHLQPYFVMLKKGEDDCNQRIGNCELNKILGKWSSQIDQDHFVLMVVVRSDQNWAKMYYAINVGNELRAKGVGPDTLSLEHWARGTNSGVPYLPKDLKGYATHIVADINSIIDKTSEESATAANHKKFVSELRGGLSKGATALLIVLILLLALSRYRKNRDNANDFIDEWSKNVNNANSNFLEIHNAYFGFFDEHGSSWRQRFGGETLAAYTNAVTLYSSLSSRVAAANDRLEEARIAAKRTNLVDIRGYLQAIAFLTSIPCTVSGDSLPFRERGLFASEVREENYLPGALLADMEDLFEAVKTELETITTSFERAEDNSHKIDETLAQARALINQLSEHGIFTSSYKDFLREVSIANDAYKTNCTKNPLGASEQSDLVLLQVRNLVAELDTASALAAVIVQAYVALTATEAVIEEKRTHLLNYSFPYAHPPANAARTYLLSEEGHNPDALASEIRRLLQVSLEALNRGDLSGAQEEERKVLEVLKDLSNICEVSDQAAQYVCENVLVLSAAHKLLAEQIPGAQKALEAVKTEFAEANFVGIPEKISTALERKNEFPNRLSVIEQQYFEQHFMAAASNLRALSEDIQNARYGLTAVHNAAETLPQLRQKVRELDKQLEHHFLALEARVKETTFTTAALTEKEFFQKKNYCIELSNLATLKTANWAGLCDGLEGLRLEIFALANAVEKDFKTYTSLISELASCKLHLENATSYVHDPRVRDIGPDLQEAAEIINQTEVDAKHPKSDWNNLSQRLVEVGNKIASAKQKADRDITAAIEATDLIETAIRQLNLSPRSHLSSRYVRGKSFAFSSGINTADADTFLANAQLAYDQRRFEEAIDLTGQSIEALSNAQNNAEIEASDLLNRAVSQWESEESQRIIAERDRAREISLNSYNNTSGYGGSYNIESTDNPGTFGGSTDADGTFGSGSIDDSGTWGGGDD